MHSLPCFKTGSQLMCTKFAALPTLLCYLTQHFQCTGCRGGNSHPRYGCAQVLGLTVLAWGNSIGDMSTNLAMARKGLANMAMTACYAGPVFNLLVRAQATPCRCPPAVLMLSAGSALGAGSPCMLQHMAEPALPTDIRQGLLITCSSRRAGRHLGAFILSAPGALL